jgi:signal peptidase I
MLHQSPAEMTAVSELPRPRLHRRSFLRELIDTLVLIGAIYALVNLASVRFIVEGPSMQPNFETGQFLIVSRINYLLGEPQRGDIVVFHPPGKPEDEPPYIKRVIGLPGETVEIRDARVYINGVELFEPYINEPCIPARCDDQRWELGPDEYFVMGDNRNHSQDSRGFDPIHLSNIIGEAVIRYWPPQDWGLVSQIAYPGDSPQ